MSHRIFVEWKSGAYVSSLDPNFQASLLAFVKQYGPPSKVEYRAAGEGLTNRVDRLEPISDDDRTTAERATRAAIDSWHNEGGA